ncbi:14365_t:CDS:2, partial [Ambispora leptoticha]
NNNQKSNLSAGFKRKSIGNFSINNGQSKSTLSNPLHEDSMSNSLSSSSTTSTVTLLEKPKKMRRASSSSTSSSQSVQSQAPASLPTCSKSPSPVPLSPTLVPQKSPPEGRKASMSLNLFKSVSDEKKAPQFTLSEISSSTATRIEQSGTDYFSAPLCSLNKQEKNSESCTITSDDDLDDEDCSDYGEKDVFQPESPRAVPLTPFANQVGGHTSFFRFSKKAVCKPLCRQENLFYETLETQHPELLPYVPKYLGVLNVTYKCQGTNRLPEVVIEQNKHILPRWMFNKVFGNDENKDEKKWLNEGLRGSTRVNNKLKEEVLREVLSPRAIRSKIRQVRALQKEPSLKRRHSTLSLSSLTKSKNDSKEMSRSFTEIKMITKQLSCSRSEENYETTPQESEHWETNNPWSLHCLTAQLSKSNVQEEKLEQFILLEDLTGGLKYPCVLDLKMGTRQFGIDATPSKRDSQMKKCAKTTSKTLGVRICGMQASIYFSLGGLVYKTTKNTFDFTDKYQGRKLNASSFREALGEFLNNGQGVLVHHIPTIIRKLRNLARIIRSLSGYRFYASSLLLIYDGDPQNSQEIDIRLIDFAHCTTGDDYTKEECHYPPSNPSSFDTGYMLGLKNLVKAFTSIYYSHTGVNLEDENDTVFDGISSNELSSKECSMIKLATAT